MERDARNNLLDAMSTISFLIGVMNLQENVSQSDMQDLVQTAIDDIHSHLLEQDKKIDLILKMLEVNKADEKQRTVVTNGSN